MPQALPSPSSHMRRVWWGTDLLRADDHLVAEPRRVAQRRGHAAGHALQRQRHHRAAGPQDVAAGRVRVAQRRVQEHVRNAGPPDVQLRAGSHIITGLSGKSLGAFVSWALLEKSICLR